MDPLYYSKSTYFLVDLLNRGYKAGFYDSLREEMFERDVDRKVFRAIKEGYKFSIDDMVGFREVAGIGFSDVVELVTLAGNSKNWVVESDIDEFVQSFNKKRSEECLERGDVEGAIKYLQAKDGKQEGIIEGYKRHLEESAVGAEMGLLGLPTGIPKLDRVSSGLRKSKLWVVGGYNAYGKTYFMTNIANRILDMGKKVCIVTLEMTKEDILDRMIGERLGIGVYELAKSCNKGAVGAQVEKFKGHIDRGELCILDSLYDIEKIISKVKIEHHNGPIDVLLLDFIQLVQDKNSKSMYETVSRVAARLQEFTKELGVCSVILSQISNEAQKNQDSSVYGFKGAGEIGQVADIAIRIERERDNEGSFTDRFDLNVVKNRSGLTGLIYCKITFPSGSITQMSDEEIFAIKTDM